MLYPALLGEDSRRPSPQLRNKGKSGPLGNHSKQGGWKNRTYMDSISNRCYLWSKLMRNAGMPTGGREPTAYLCFTEVIMETLLESSDQLALNLQCCCSVSFYWLKWIPQVHKAITNLDSILKSRVITLPTKVHIVKAMFFSVAMYRYESWTIKKAECWRIDVFEVWCWRRLLDSEVIKPVNPKRNQSWIFIERTDADAEAPIPWSPDAKNWLIRKDPDARKDWRQRRRGW